MINMSSERWHGAGEFFTHLSSTRRRDADAPRINMVICRVLTLAVLAVTISVSSILTCSAAPYKVLVYSATAGFRHDSITNGLAAIQALGSTNNFSVDNTEDATAFSDANLAQYKAIVFLCTTGDVLTNNAQQTALQNFVRAGGGWVGIHSAADTLHNWSWYGGLVGAYFDSHPAVQSGTVKVIDPIDPS